MEHYIARQPIFDRHQKVYAYELLFRSGLANYFDGSNQDKAASSVIADSTILFGFDTLTSGKRAFLNMTKDTLINYAQLLPKNHSVLEILETVDPDDEVVATVKRLKNQGFTIALDDFIYNERWEPLVKLADIIKIDFLATTVAERQSMVTRLKAQDKMLLAEKVETQEEHQQAFDMGFDFFQGYFFEKPVILTKRGMAGNKITNLQILQQINKPGMDYREIEEIIKKDLTLSYKLMHYINSAFFGLQTEIRSIKHALVLMGEREIRKWATLLALSTMSEEKPLELMKTAATRARMCELIARKIGQGDKSADYFLMGLFSIIDAIMDRNLAEILKDIPLARDIKNALMRIARNPFRMALEITLNYERGIFKDIPRWAARLKLPEKDIPEIYMEAVKWAQEMQAQ
ncbi:EAL and HDOD domain-containing protein [Acanthopleuribacter pedis]|uniref:HDOD domain-containing protein n=1 Tax=Acanthopleuribacter pedis TaxID=442870 RepID=A0A8J7U3F5_9BACT|nr:HDOD domain-containing protein [Acanthopleuribacter pedis]MBO1319577.1 HDOD domain-containing protein [Acanthopleuribacter pedis]